MGTVRQCPSRHCDPSASQAAGNTRGKAIQRHVLRSQCCLAWGRVTGCGDSPEGAAPHSLLRFVLQLGTNQPPAAPPLRGRGVCTGAGIAQHWQRLPNADWGSPTPQAVLDAVCTCAPRTGGAGEIHGRGCVCRTQGAVFSGGGRLRVQREAGVAKRAYVCAGAGSQPGSAGHRPASSPSVPLSPPSCGPARSGSWGLYKGRETSASSKESLRVGGVLPPSCLHVIQLPHVGSRGQASL